MNAFPCRLAMCHRRGRARETLIDINPSPAQEIVMHALLSALKRFVDEETCPVNDGCVAGFVSGAHTGWGWARNRIGDLVTKHKPHIPPSALCVFRDGNQWCCVSQDFIDLATSPAGFGETVEEAILKLSVSA